jgi:enoyl-[acyl-carrier protein] reductase II
VINQLDNKKVTLSEAQLKIEHFWAGSLREAVINGDIENGSLMAGQSVSLVKKKQKVKEIFDEILAQAERQIVVEREFKNE